MTTIYQVSEDDLIIEGVRIKLTKEQKDLIGKERNKRKRCRSNFSKMLMYFGFKPVRGLVETFENAEKGWYAEIHRQRSYDYVWMVGQGLKCGGFPGGWEYSEPKEIEEELIKHK